MNPGCASLHYIYIDLYLEIVVQSVEEAVHLVVIAQLHLAARADACVHVCVHVCECVHACQHLGQHQAHDHYQVYILPFSASQSDVHCDHSVCAQHATTPLPHEATGSPWAP